MTTQEIANDSQEEPAGNTSTAGSYQIYNWFATIKAKDLSPSQVSQLFKEMDCKKWTFQLEMGEESAYQHYQCFFSLRRKEKLHQVKNQLPKYAHVEPARDRFEAENYCKKVETRIAGPWTEKSSFIRIITTLRPWQVKVDNLVRKELAEYDDRSIWWFWEPSGNIGKTQFCKYLNAVYGATLLQNSSTANIACALDEDPKICVWNLPKDESALTFNYNALESVKDGLIFSSKYKSNCKVFNSPIVIVFANFPPDTDKLSADRWKIEEL